MAPNSKDQHNLSPLSDSDIDTESKDPLPIPPESIRIEDKVYSARALAKIHPGGPLFVKSFAGKFVICCLNESI